MRVAYFENVHSKDGTAPTSYFSSTHFIYYGICVTAGMTQYHQVPSQMAEMLHMLAVPLKAQWVTCAICCVLRISPVDQGFLSSSFLFLSIFQFCFNFQDIYSCVYLLIHYSMCMCAHAVHAYRLDILGFR